MDMIKITKVENVQFEQGQKVAIGSLHLTTHQLIISLSGRERWISYPLIQTVERRPQRSDGLWPLIIRRRDFVLTVISMPSESEAIDVFECVQKLTCISSIEQVYAFFFKPQLTCRDGWKVYDPITEFERMGLSKRDCAWRFTNINRNYGFCSTYPHILVVPHKIGDSTLQHAGKFRSKHRIPTLTYLHWANEASITRSSQPMVGIQMKRSTQDEKLIEAIFQSSAPQAENGRPVYGSTARNLIVDARPTANAYANRAMGFGSEHIENYKNCEKQHMGIHNIHVMRESLNKMVEVIQAASVQCVPVKHHHLEKSNWLKHISDLLESTIVIINTVHVTNSHVLVHCSDGWDRTSQLTSIAELCLDPHYRTFRGFQVLIEKDWVSFGYKFSDRSGHLSNEKYFITSTSTNAALNSMRKNLYSGSYEREISPVFHQFLDCVYQLLQQYPTRFEFNEKFLKKLHYHVYSCQYGTFLFNSERERTVYNVRKVTCSVWDYFNSKKTKFLNPAFDHGAADREDMRNRAVIFPDSKNVKYWAGLFGKTDEELNGDGAIDETAEEKSGSVSAKWNSESPRADTPDPLGATNVNSDSNTNENATNITSKLSRHVPVALDDPWRDEVQPEEQVDDRKAASKQSNNDINAKDLLQNIARLTRNVGAAAYSNIAAMVNLDVESDSATENSPIDSKDNASDGGSNSETTTLNLDEDKASSAGPIREIVSLPAPISSASASDTPPSPPTPTRPWHTIQASFNATFPSISLSRENRQSFSVVPRSNGNSNSSSQNSSAPPTPIRSSTPSSPRFERSNPSSPLATPTLLTASDGGPLERPLFEIRTSTGKSSPPSSTSSPLTASVTTATPANVSHPLL